MQLWDLLSLHFRLSPRLAHATERFVPCNAADIPSAGKNTSGDAALQWEFLTTQHQQLYQLHPQLHGWANTGQEQQLYHKLEGLMWLWAGEAGAFFQISRSWI